jgi:hypothetical protein
VIGNALSYKWPCLVVHGYTSVVLAMILQNLGEILSWLINLISLADETERYVYIHICSNHGRNSKFVIDVNGS